MAGLEVDASDIENPVYARQHGGREAGDRHEKTGAGGRKIMPLKRDEAFWKEGMDEKRFALCCIHKIWICLAAALAGAVFAAGIYLGVRQLTMGPKQYRGFIFDRL
jgi:hypothetical protein